MPRDGRAAAPGWAHVELRTRTQDNEKPDLVSVSPRKEETTEPPKEDTFALKARSCCGSGCEGNIVMCRCSMRRAYKISPTYIRTRTRNRGHEHPHENERECLPTTRLGFRHQKDSTSLATLKRVHQYGTEVGGHPVQLTFISKRKEV